MSTINIVTTKITKKKKERKRERKRSKNRYQFNVIQRRFLKFENCSENLHPLTIIFMSNKNIWPHFEEVRLFNIFLILLCRISVS